MTFIDGIERKYVERSEISAKEKRRCQPLQQLNSYTPKDEQVAGEETLCKGLFVQKREAVEPHIGIGLSNREPSPHMDRIRNLDPPSDLVLRRFRADLNIRAVQWR